ncbi:18084_t:CDS:1 [Racocetra fulgida]|uniref:18084_t:CDS:1 n=1 Tax=Racocetra fulgida TaxID=60492 RepID=A0A9N9A082_9GLOM|nr:18084_t:CDS:1 [Racocetra fulgida]
MPRPTNNKKKSKQAYEAKAHKHNITVNNSEAENSDNFSYDEAVENNNATSIVKRLQAAANNYYSDNNVLKNYDNESLFAHDELIEIENDNAEGFAKTLLNAANTFYRESDSNKSCKPRYLGNSICTKRRKRQQQREAAKGMPTLFTFWNQDKTAEEDIEVELSDDGWLDEVDEDDTGGLSEDEIETSNWYKKI